MLRFRHTSRADSHRLMMDDYLPMRDYAMIGNCRTAALISRHGSVDWCCLPRFDSPALFCRLLDAKKGPFFQVAPKEETDVERSYQPDTNILGTRFRCSRGELLLSDFMPVMPEGENDQDDLACARILRLLEVKEGSVEVKVQLRPGFDFARSEAEVCFTSEGCRGRAGDEHFFLTTPGSLQKSGDVCESVFRMSAGDRLWVTFSYGRGEEAPHVSPEDADAALLRTQTFWREWIGKCKYDGPHLDLVKRSALVLKSLIYQPTGGLIAAPVTSLPERMGADLNWDFRFAWLRDSGLVIDVLQRLGYHEESMAFLDWVEGLCGASKSRLQPVYRIDGSGDLSEEELPHLEGYRGSRPVRVGNAAALQFQLDTVGHVAEAAWLCYDRMPRPMKPELWETLRQLIEVALRRWREPDSGIWEDRGEPRHYLHSKLYCWVAFDRMLRLADTFDLPGDTERWREAREEVRKVILREGYDSTAGSFRQALGEEGVDASVLTIPLVGFLPTDDPRIQATLQHVQQELSVHGLISRRRSPHAQEPEQGTFLLCNFWLIDALMKSGRRPEAEALFQRVLTYGNDVGLFPEEGDPSTGEWLGPFPIGFTHLGLIRSAINFSESACHRDPEAG